MKTMKKLLSFALSLSLAVSLAVPALADEPPAAAPILSEEEFRDQYVADHPELYEAFDPDAYFAETYPWRDKEEYMKWMELEDQEAFKENLWTYYQDNAFDFGPVYEEVRDAYEVYLVDAYSAAHPGELEALTDEALLAKLGYTQTLTPAGQYMEDYDIDTEEEVRPALLAWYAEKRLLREMVHGDFAWYQETYPDQWAEFDPEAWFAEGFDFWPSKQDYMDSACILSQEEFVEAMFVSYVDENAWFWNLEWEYDDSALTVVVNGETQYDAVLTAENGVTYADAETVNALLGTNYPAADGPVALRSAAEAAGWDVTWNSPNNEVVLLDRERLLQGTILRNYDYDEATEELTWEEEYVPCDLSQFEELLRRILSASQVKEGQSYRTTGTYDFDLTTFNSLDGDKTYTLTAKVDVLTKDSQMDLTLTVNAAQLWDLLSQNTKNVLERELPKFTFQNLKTLLGGCKLQLLTDWETGEFYWNFPLLSILDETVSEDAWFHFAIPDWDLSVVAEGLAAFQAGEAGINDLLYAWMLADSADNYLGAWSSYNTLAEIRSMLNTFFGPHTMTERGGTLTWSLNTDAVNGLLNDMENAYPWDDEEPVERRYFREYDLSFSVSRDGKTTYTAAIRPDMDAIAAAVVDNEWFGPGETALTTWALNLFDFRETAQSTRSGDHAAGKVQFQWKNQFELDMEMTSDRKEVKDAPRTTPPEDAETIDLDL